MAGKYRSVHKRNHQADYFLASDCLRGSLAIERLWVAGFALQRPDAARASLIFEVIYDQEAQQRIGVHS